MFGAEEARHNPNVVTGTFLLNNHYASILFDSGAERSFVSLEFRPSLSIGTTKLNDTYVIEYANGHEYEAREILLGCTMNLADRLFSINLIPVELGSFDVVVGWTGCPRSVQKFAASIS